MLSVDQGQNNADAARRDMEFKRRSVSIKLLNINEDDDDDVSVSSITPTSRYLHCVKRGLCGYLIVLGAIELS